MTPAVLLVGRVFWRTPHRTFQRAKGAAGTEFLTTQKEIQDALAQGLKEAKSGASCATYRTSAQADSMLHMRGQTAMLAALCSTQCCV